MTDDERKLILGEVLMDELKAIREYVEDLPHMKDRLARVETKLDKLSDDMDVVKSVIKSHSGQLRDHESRFKLLEQAA